MPDPPSANGPVPIVIVHRNEPELLAASLVAWSAQTVPVEVVLVDSGSTADHRAAAVAALPMGATVIATGRNRGFGPSANAGFRAVLAVSSAPWIGLAPHDALPAPDAVERILAAVATRPRAGLACGDYGDGTSPVVNPYLGAIQVASGTDDGWDPVGYPHGTLLLARRALLEDVGLFDERYFAYGEEADLGLRARSADWEVGLVRGAVVRNPSMSTTRAAVDYLMVRNTLLLLRTHFGRYHAAVRLLMAVGQLWTGRHRDPYHHLAGRTLALRDHCLGRYGEPPPDVVALGGPVGGRSIGGADGPSRQQRRRRG